MAGERVLIVEDNEKNMKLFRDVLSAKGYRTLEATSGAQAIELALEHAPDLVLMDIRLPDVDGVEALGRLRSDERTTSIPVVAVTAQAMRGDRERFLAAGFDGYVPKPVDIAELAATVREHCEGGARMTEVGRILVVDDVPQNVRLLEAVLKPRGYEVVTAADGPAALALVESADPDLVLLDVVMPEMDGYAVCRRIREREETRRAPGDHGHVERRAGEEAGDRGRCGRLRAEALRPARAAHTRPLASAHQALPRHHQDAGLAAARAQPDARGTRSDPARRARAVAAPAPIPLAPAQRGDRLVGRRVDPREPPTGGRDVLRRPPRLDELRRHASSRRS